MSIKLLWVYEQGMLESQAHIIEHLRRHDIDVTLEAVTLEQPRWERLVENDVVDRHIAAGYDFHMIVTHNGNPHVQRFQQLVKPAIGTFDLEHDLFHDYPEQSPDRVSIGTFAFTRKHENHLQRSRRRYIRCRWYKLNGARFDGPTWERVKPPFHFVADADALVIGSTLWQWPEFRWHRHFHTVWYKPFAAHDREMAKTRRLPDEFTNTQAVMELAKVSRFWFTYESSCFVEALLLGRIPILCNERMIESSPVDEVLDRVKIIARDVGNGGELTSMLAVTQKDFDRKIQHLRKHEVYERTHQILYSEYFEPNEHELPRVEDALLEQIGTWWRSRHADHH